MRENTPPASPFHNEADDEELIYVGDNIDDVIEQLEEIPDDGAERMDEIEEEDDEGMEGGDEDEPEDSPPERDDAVRTFSKHTDSLFCGSFNPDGSLAVTGGEDDKAYVWNVENGEVTFEITEHKDSVIAAEFSYDGTLLATGDMAGEVRVFKVEKDYKKVWEFSMGDMSWMKWHKKANVLLAGSEVGEIYIWRIPSGDCKILPGAGEKCEVACFTNDNVKLAAGYGDGTFKLWDLKTQQILLNVPPENKTNENEDESLPPPAITSLCTDSENSLVIAGCIDGVAKLYGSNGVIGTLAASPTSKTSELYSVERVLLDCPGFEVKVAVTGSLNGKVYVWDVAHQSIRNECQDDHPGGITTMIWGKDQTIIAGTIGGAIKVWNVRNGELKCTLLGHANNIHDLCYHEKKNMLLTVSEDKTAKIFMLPM